ncbi:unnamed protein product, partial [Lepidochelys olivacea]
MKGLLSVLLAAIVCVELAHTLQCYTCQEPMSSPLCMTISNCSTDDIMCKTVMYSREE